MRILHVTECHAGGISRAIETAVRLTPDNEHHLLWSGKEEPAADGNYASITPLPSSLVARTLAVRRTVNRLQPDVVHAHSSWAGLYTRLLPFGRGVIYQPHGYKFTDSESGRLPRFIFRVVEKFLAPRSAGIAVLSPHEDRLAKSLNARVTRYFIPNAPTMDVREYRATGDALADVVMIGRVCSQKDPVFFADVAREVRRQVPDVRFRWIGDGPSEARQILESTGIEVTGWLNKREVAAALDLPAIYFHSARYEGFPLSLLDAAARRVPIVARRIAAFEGTPILQVDDVSSAARQISLVLTDQQERHEATAAGQELLSSMNSERQAAALKSMYLSIRSGGSQK
ncbi:glycosyltransferase [Agreia sp. Leaf244]|uniref:glycosyltransferase n=1 Tax=Agreia sp. Leaf244 TaxID=1736305 RepID=UPI0009E76D6D|nr:glycosyltransferase [Agreia sp. Leaf244]